MALFDGYCQTTSAGTVAGGACPNEHEVLGSFGGIRYSRRRLAWAAAARDCATRCLACPRCNYISVSVQWNDCSWFHECALDRLHNDVIGHKSMRVRFNENSAVALYTYDPPLHELNISEAYLADYRTLMRDAPADKHAYTSASWHIHNQLPRVLPATRDVSAPTTLFFVPIAPWHFCLATNEHTRHRHHNFATRSVDRAFDQTRLGARMRMRSALTWPRTKTFLEAASHHWCPEYERVLDWVFRQPTWHAAPERHLWVFELPHVARATLYSERQHLGRAVSRPAKLARGLLLAQEDRCGDYLDAVAQRKLVLVPFFSPGFFRLRASTVGELAPLKTTLAAESSGDGVTCHRFDDCKPLKSGQGSACTSASRASTRVGTRRRIVRSARASCSGTRRFGSILRSTSERVVPCRRTSGPQRRC